jgi:hypothetical protein
MNEERFLSPRPGAHKPGARKSRVAPFEMTVVSGRWQGGLIVGIFETR